MSAQSSTAGGDHTHGPLVAVTGGAGFIGSHTVDRLLEAGYQVVVIDDFSTGKRANLVRWADDPRLEVVIANVADGVFAPLADVTRRRGPVERIVHLAAQVSVVHSVGNPLDDLRVNCGGTVQVLEYARATGVRKVVFASSAAVYGEVDAVPVTEDVPCRPLSPYGIDKRASELYLDYYSAVHGVPVTTLRFFNVFGPRQDPSNPYSGVISIFASRASAGLPLTIFGDGEQSRDFVYVGDVARAVVTACVSDRADREILNIGTGRETTVLKLARTVVDLCGTGGRGADLRHAPERPGEVRRSLAGVDHARKVLGFEAQMPFADGLRQTLAWAAE